MNLTAEDGEHITSFHSLPVRTGDDNIDLNDPNSDENLRPYSRLSCVGKVQAIFPLRPHRYRKENGYGDDDGEDADSHLLRQLSKAAIEVAAECRQYVRTWSSPRDGDGPLACVLRAASSVSPPETSPRVGEDFLSGNVRGSFDEDDVGSRRKTIRCAIRAYFRGAVVALRVRISCDDGTWARRHLRPTKRRFRSMMQEFTVILPPAGENTSTKSMRPLRKIDKALLDLLRSGRRRRCVLKSVVSFRQTEDERISSALLADEYRETCVVDMPTVVVSPRKVCIPRIDKEAYEDAHRDNGGEAVDRWGAGVRIALRKDMGNWAGALSCGLWDRDASVVGNTASDDDKEDRERWGSACNALNRQPNDDLYASEFMCPMHLAYEKLGAVAVAEFTRGDGSALLPPWFVERVVCLVHKEWLLEDHMSPLKGPSAQYAVLNLWPTIQGDSRMEGDDEQCHTMVLRKGSINSVI